MPPVEGNDWNPGQAVSLAPAVSRSVGSRFITPAALDLAQSVARSVGSIRHTTQLFSQTLLPVGVASEVVFGLPTLTYRRWIYPTSDTLRGGALITAYSRDPIDPGTYDWDAVQAPLPAPWSTALVGSASAGHTASGYRLRTGPVAGSSVSISRTYSSHGVVVVKVRLLDVPTLTISDGAAVIALAVSSSSFVAEIKVRTVDACLICTAEITRQGITEPAGSTQLPELDFLEVELLLATGGDRVYGRLAVADVCATILESEVEGISTDTKTVSISSANGPTYGNQVQTDVLDFGVRPGMFIGRFWVPAASEISFSPALGARYSWVGVVPAAPITSLGTHDVTVFGTWGVTNLQAKFEYTLPPPLVVVDNAVTLKVVSDRVLRTDA